VQEGGPTFVSMVLRGSGKRPVCHFDIQETLDYMSRRPFNMKNENGLNSPIEVTDIRVAELESIGLQTRNTFRFYVTNTTSANYEFLWESLGDPSPFWRCVQGAGMMYSGKRIEMVFEYLPEEVAVAEAFFKFRIPNMMLEQTFLFTGKVEEPKVFFSTSKIDFHSVMLGGEGGNETIYLENKEHLPFNFSFERHSLQQLEGAKKPILQITPKSGTVGPNGKVAISLLFGPQEEVQYNYNIHLDVKRKPNKLSLNVKGEGYAVHPLIQLEQSEDQAIASGNSKSNLNFLTLKPAPAMNFADFGSVQVLDTMAKVLNVTNNGKFNFDYVWDIQTVSSMLALAGGRMGGTLLKGEELSYKLVFAPDHEGDLGNSVMTLTVAGKYQYNILARGAGVKPALRFSFMHYDFDYAFVTPPGGTVVVEETVLTIVNHDTSSNISIECIFQKTRALAVDCPPTVIAPGAALTVPIRFAPREVKDYAFIVPFLVNGSSRVPVNVTGKGIHARIELVNGSQRRTNFGVVNVGSSSTRSVALVNRSKKAVPVQLLEAGDHGSGNLSDRCIEFSPSGEFMIEPRATANVQLVFSPNKRISQFNEDLLVRYAGVTKSLLNVSGKSQGIEISLDSDSLPFGVVVLDSQKIKKLTLENVGDISISFQWMEATFGQHFSITPLSGKLLPGTEATFDVIFTPQSIDEDIRQDGITLMIPGLDPLTITATGCCIEQPAESVDTIRFSSLARKTETKSVKIDNPTDKDWYLTPSLKGEDWKVPHEFKVPAKGSADLTVSYFPLTMTPPSEAGQEEVLHQGQMFIALPDGSARLYKLVGKSGEPECSGRVAVETPAKKAATVILKVDNWLHETQKLNVKVELFEKASPATFIIAANATEVMPKGTKEFPVRFISYMEGKSTGRITFTNPVSGEYTYYDVTATTTMGDVVETIAIESPVRQTARYVISIENPLPTNSPVTMVGAQGKPEWWSCDSAVVKINELSAMDGSNEGSFEVEFRPLVPTPQPTEHLLIISTKELGTFKYKLLLKSTPPLLKQILRFDVPLGSMQTEQFVFHAYNEAKSDFICTVTKPDFFTVQKSLVVDAVSDGWAGNDIRLPIVFEPTEIGEVRDTLTVISPVGGSYVCELVANCIAPMPQGPFNFVQGGVMSMDIPFRNCFTSTCSWSFTVDHDAFRVAAPTASVNQKTEGKCTVLFEPTEEHVKVLGGFITAKLFITCSTKSNISPWVFYLRAKVDPSLPFAKGKK
jgi:hydrocephalus-inducing protein